MTNWFRKSASVEIKKTPTFVPEFSVLWDADKGYYAELGSLDFLLVGGAVSLHDVAYFDTEEEAIDAVYYYACKKRKEYLVNKRLAVK